MNPKVRSVYLRTTVGPRYRKLRRTLSEIGRALTFKKHVVQVFLQLDDPYSYLLSQYLQHVATHYKVEFRYYLSQALRGEFMPQPAMLAEYAIKDCRLLARELGIPFLDDGDTPVVEFRRPLLDFLADEHDEEEFNKTFTKVLAMYWRGNTESAARLVGRGQLDKSATNVLVSKNQLLLRKLGHYNSAMMHYGGEWYWGVDRLHYLTSRLDELGLGRYKEPNAELASLSRATQLSLPGAVPAKSAELPPLHLYFSFRSPYSYLSLKRAFEIADAFGVKVDLRPVLPMVMRGLPVPTNKLLYVVRDAAREAERSGIGFGNIADPVGAGAERCIAVFYYAKEQGKEREFVLAAGNAIWHEAIDVATDEGMRTVSGQAGLFWPDVSKVMEEDGWKEKAKQNQQYMDDAGVWGVPVFMAGDFVIWGQDRGWILARHFEDLCHGGEGILV